jgi:hypothetical protein
MQGQSALHPVQRLATTHLGEICGSDGHRGLFCLPTFELPMSSDVKGRREQEVPNPKICDLRRPSKVVADRNVPNSAASSCSSCKSRAYRYFITYLYCKEAFYDT